jgi:hypothetical protein
MSTGLDFELEVNMVEVLQRSFCSNCSISVWFLVLNEAIPVPRFAQAKMFRAWRIRLVRVALAPLACGLWTARSAQKISTL